MMLKRIKLHDGGIYLAVWKQPSFGIDEKADVMLHLNRKQLVLLEMLLDHAYKQGPLIPKSAPHEDAFVKGGKR